MKILLKKEICESREQCTGSTEQCNFNVNFAIKEVVGPVHSAQDPLTDNILHDGALLNKKKKKKRKKEEEENANAQPPAAIQMHT